MLNIFKKQEYKTYKYKIIFKNKNTSEGTLTAPNLDGVYEMLLKNKFQIVSNGTKGFYWNANEINTLEVYLLEKVKEE